MIRGDSRTFELTLQGGDHSDHSESVASKHDRLGLGGNVPSNELEELTRLDRVLIAGQVARQGRDDVEPGPSVIGGAEGVQLGVEPRRVEQGDALAPRARSASTIEAHGATTGSPRERVRRRSSIAASPSAPMM